MTIDKRINYINQDGYKNYIKNSDSITIPKKFKARKKATSTHLAYITKAEAAQLKKQNKGTPHKGPKGIPSYDSFDAAGGYTSGTAMSAAETGSSNQRDRAEVRASNIGGPKGLAPGVTSNQAQELRDSFLKARAMGQRRSGIGGLLGALGRGALGFFGGIPGKLLSGIMTAKNWAKNKGTGFVEGAKDFIARDDEGNPLYPTLEKYWNRDKLEAIEPIQAIESMPTNQEIIGKRIGQDEGHYGTGSQYDQSRVMPENITPNTGANNQIVDPNFYAGNKEGGRIGYNRGRVVNPGGYQGEEEGVDSVKHAIMLEQMDKLEKMIASGLDSDGRLQAKLDQLIATPTTGFGTGPDLVLPDDNPDLIPPDDMAQGGIARLL